jgi:hypothetical protein
MKKKRVKVYHSFLMNYEQRFNSVWIDCFCLCCFFSDILWNDGKLMLSSFVSVSIRVRGRWSWKEDNKKERTDIKKIIIIEEKERYIIGKTIINR